MEPSGKREAQRRVDRIRAFREELQQLECEGILALDAEQRLRVEGHFKHIVSDFASRFDVDADESQKRISWGMRIASVLGAVALCAAVVLFLQRIWGLLPAPAHAVILTGTPLLLLGATEFAARREKTLCYAGLLSLVAIAAFVAGLSILGAIFNVPGSPGALLAWGAFALILACHYGLWLPLVAAVGFLISWLAALLAAWSGIYWVDFMMRPETLLPGGLLAIALPLLARLRPESGFGAVCRVCGLLVVFVALFALAVGAPSYLTLDRKDAQTLYQFAGLIGSALAIWLGVRGGLASVVNVGCLSFVVFLFVKLFEWWWDWMPKYLFFLLVGLIALTLLAVFRKLRARLAKARKS